MGVCQDCVPGFGDFQTTGPAMEKGDAKEFLELLHLDRYGRLCNGHCFCGSGETEMVGDHLEYIQLMEIQLATGRGSIR